MFPILPALGALTKVAVPIVASWVGAKAQQEGAESANILQVSEAERNRQWQTEMSNTAHQREVEDLKKAGLNPVLSATHGGASTPSSVMPSTLNPSQNFAQSGVQLARLMAEVDLLNAQAERERSQVTLNDVIGSTKALQSYVSRTAAGGAKMMASSVGSVATSRVSPIVNMMRIVQNMRNRSLLKNNPFINLQSAKRISQLKKISAVNYVK